MAEEIKITRDLSKYSIEELDNLYAVLARGIGNNEPSIEMRDIEKEMQRRYDEVNTK